jgi:hypothetical protein
MGSKRQQITHSQATADLDEILFRHAAAKLYASGCIEARCFDELKKEFYARLYPDSPEVNDGK